ncbi:penicillin-binding protein activator [Shewanella alkalitolerans]|uniref:penicillin-binding protein activator n=1 Tax=Shewanella alkalitolerans TaxID=2864209 RepID=UPI001C6575D2|nr:penicillin-binding protein activator [Shewanella alkalitolerans]QYJ97900.1 penicillin-binding protein activator [Shewanella alkalitolerans]
MLKRLNTTKLISAAVLATVLFGCATAPTPVKETSTQVSLVNATQSPAEYLANAKQATDAEQKNRLMLLAAHAFINQGDTGNASKTLAAVKPNLVNKPEILAEHRYLSARVLEQTANYDQALAQLNYPSKWRLANWQMVSYHQLKARLFQLSKSPIEQAKELTLLATYLPNAEASEVNDEIWGILQPLHEQTLLAFSQDSSNPIFAGWLQLAYVAKHYAIDPQQLVQQLGNWQQDNPGHPGAKKLPTDLERALNTKPYKPKKIAVLLPLTGPRAAIADTVKQGIISSYLTNPDDSVSVNFFDTAQGAELAQQQAIAAGADFIIGPLLQSEVESLMQAEAKASQQADGQQQPGSQAQAQAQVQPKVPQLFLNHVDSFTPSNDQFFFALSPTDEAVDAAQKLYNDGIEKPLLLASDDAVGRRMAEAFNGKWQELTHEAAEIHYYKRGDEMKVTVQKSLGVIDSKERIARIKALLGNKIEADFRSRRDIDAIYMIASSQDLPLLKPFIDVNFSVFAEPVPLYTTSRSRIESQSRTAAQELNNLTISDIPWLIETNAETAEVARLWPTWGNSQKRLYVMGFDALQLVSKLAQMRALPGYQYSGRSGLLSVSPDGTINRQLSWGRYQRGNLRPL